MILGNNPINKNNFNNQRNNNIHQNNSSIPSMPNNFENRWNKVQEYNRSRPENKNIFVKDIKEQKYASATDTQGMQDKSLAMLNERLQQGTISLDEFNKKCAELGRQRQNNQRNNKLF